jgi:hypothetical protein
MPAKKRFANCPPQSSGGFIPRHVEPCPSRPAKPGDPFPSLDRRLADRSRQPVLRRMGRTDELPFWQPAAEGWMPGLP